jgi:carbohydrate kinase (thermoresistant glucokinase family)
MTTDTMVIILMGPMGCGKTTVGKRLAEATGWQFLDGDKFHPQDNVEKMRAAIPLTDEDRQSWLEKLRHVIRQQIASGQSAILACSALKQAYRERLGVNQKTVKTVYLKGSYELLNQRIASRQHPYMAKGLLKSQLDILEAPEDGLTVDISRTPDAIVKEILGWLGKTTVFF